MAKARVLIPSKEEALAAGLSGFMPKLAIYHVTSRVVHRQLLFSPEAKEQFRVFLRMYERFSGCRVLSYCVMTNHFHLLLEVPELPKGEDGEIVAAEDLGLSEEQLLWRLGGLYSRASVAAVKEEIAEARRLIADDYHDFEKLDALGKEQNRELGKGMLREIFSRFTKRMHNLSLFMKGLLQRFTRWFNKENGLRGTLWEERFHSVIVESGTACRMMAAYIDLNPVRAGICVEPEDYRWSSYGEAIGAGRGAAKARSGLVRALHAHAGREGSNRAWSQGGVSKEYRRILVSEGTEATAEMPDGEKLVKRRGKKRALAEVELNNLSTEESRDLKISKVVRCRVRYFKDGAVLGSRSFVDGIFQLKRKQFGAKRTTGARKPRGALGDLSGEIWALRDLQKE